MALPINWCKTQLSEYWGNWKDFYTDISTAARYFDVEQGTAHRVLNNVAALSKEV